MSTYVCFSVIEFADDGELDYMILHRGSLESCERVRDMIPAVAYSSDRPVKRAAIGILEETFRPAPNSGPQR